MPLLGPIAGLFRSGRSRTLSISIRARRTQQKQPRGPIFRSVSGQRFYRPGVGRWTNRDPITERGGLNLYGFVANLPVSQMDYLGKIIASPPTGCLRDMMELFATQQGYPNRISWQVLACMAAKESGYDPCAKGDAGDTGLMQLLKSGGAIAECQAMGVLPTNLSFDKEECCKWECQPKICHLNGDPDQGWVREKCACDGCEDSVWNIENQMKCAAAYLRRILTSVPEKVSLGRMLCEYNEGLGDPDCLDPNYVANKDYVVQIQECLSNLSQANPGAPGVIVPLSGAQ